MPKALHGWRERNLPTPILILIQSEGNDKKVIK